MGMGGLEGREREREGGTARADRHMWLGVNCEK